MPSHDRLSEFAAIVESGSISAAARVLGLQRPTLSRRLSALEAELGVRLVHRSTTELTLTRAGEELGRRARRFAADAEEAWSAVRRMDDVPRGLLRVSTAGEALDELLLRFVEEYPEVSIEVLETARVVNLIAEGIDVAVRFGAVRDGNLIARRVAAIKRIVVASPDYLARHGRPETAADLAEHSCLVGYGLDGSPTKTWPLRSGGRVPVAGRVAGNGLRMLRTGACRGLGLALLTAPYAREQIELGTLVPLLVDELGDSVSVSIVFPERQYLDPKVRVFVDRAVPVLRAAYGDPEIDSTQ